MANEDKELEEAIICDYHFKMYGSAMSATKRIVWTHFRNTRYVPVSMPRPLSHSGQLLGSCLTDRLDMVSVKDESNN